MKLYVGLDVGLEEKLQTGVESMTRKALVKAFAYLRTSSETNVGEDKDSHKRQLAAIERFAKRHGFTIVSSFSDDAVSGEDDIASRPGFSAMLDALEANGTRTVIVEDASRFARKVLVQELGIVSLIARQVSCWSAGGDMELTNTDDEFKVAMRQIAATFAELEKKRLVKKLKAARDRKREEIGKCGGRKSYAERATKDERTRAMLAKAKELRAQRPRHSLREISAALQATGYVTPKGNSYAASAVSSMLGE
jgi:DNA invertase Pin-like site-specific DNA recombinase